MGGEEKHSLYFRYERKIMKVFPFVCFFPSAFRQLSEQFINHIFLMYPLNRVKAILGKDSEFPEKNLESHLI